MWFINTDTHSIHLLLCLAWETGHTFRGMYVWVLERSLHIEARGS